MASRPIKIDLIGDDSQLKKTLKGAGDRIGKFGKSVAKMGVTAGAAFGATAVAIGTKGVMAFSEFESGMAEVMTLLPDAGEEMFGQLSDQVKDFSKEFGVMTDDAIPGLYSALSAGVPANNVFEFMEVAQKAAAAGVTSLETAIDGISSTVNVYGSEVISATEASDLMFTAVKLGKTTFEEISGSISQMAPIASAVGIPFKDLTASIANLTAGGTPTSVAAGQMKNAIAELAKSGTKADVAFRDLTGMGLQQFLEEEGNFASAMITMKEGADAAGISVLDMFGSIEGGQAVLSLTADGGEKFIDTLQQMDAAGGSTEAAFETMDATLGASFSKIKANLQVLAIEIGEKLAPLVAKATDFMVDNFDKIKPALLEAKKFVIDFGRRATAVIKSVTKWVKDNEAWLTMLAAAIGAVIVGIKAYNLVVKAQKAITTAMTAATKIAAGAQTALNLAMSLNPIGLVVAAVVALIAILTAAYFKFETVRDIVDKVFDVFQGMADMFMDYAWPLIKRVIDSVINIFQTMWDQIKLAVDLVMALFTGDFAGAWDALKGMVSSAVGLIIDLFVDLPMDLIRAVAPLVGKFALIVADFSVHLVGKILTLIQGMPDRIIELLGTVASKVIQVGKDLGGWIISGIGNALAAIGSKILNWVHTGINSVFQSIVGLGSDIGGWIINGLLSAITGAADAIWDAIKGLIPGLGDLGGWFGKLFSSSGSRKATGHMRNVSDSVQTVEQHFGGLPPLKGGAGIGAYTVVPTKGFGSMVIALDELNKGFASGALSHPSHTISIPWDPDSPFGAPSQEAIDAAVDLAIIRHGLNANGNGNGNGDAPNITLHVNAGMGTDGRAVGDQIVSELTKWTRTNGSLPLAVAAQ